MNRTASMPARSTMLGTKDRSPLLVRLVKQCEYSSGRSSNFGRVYGKLFYQRMVAREIQHSGLLELNSERKRVLHVGCGPMPYTALALAAHGMQVTAVDNDPHAVEQARRVIAQAGLEERITVELKDACSIDPREYDGVWLSLHVYPRGRVISSYLETMRKDSVLVYRNPRNALLKRWYPRCCPPWSCTRVPQPFGKESVIMQPPTRTDVIPLSYAPAGVSGIITDVPEHPLLSPLGIRPGKFISVEARCMLGGPIALTVDGRTSAVHRSLAGKIMISAPREHQAS